MLVGYARVSTRDQNLESQVSKLKNAGCEEIYEGKYSGVGQASDEALEKLIHFVRKGDTVVITRLDRIGRSLKSIINTIDEITSKGATVKSLDGAFDTSSGSAMSKALVHLLGVFAQLERDLIADRTSEGQKRAKAAGKHVGRPPKLTPIEIKQIKSDLAAGCSVSSLARKYQVTRPTISKFKLKDSK
ncbi:hypothetical protein BSZ31_00165 [Limnobacter sp. SAORIC-690]|uniref:recombinase family protein n=1 Tax=Limnobacter sp. SAORIC-690 TaxID=1923970 RepID=UPI000CF56FE1|nr:recombinase family protein [Limnobacter sp. SAORIC-690]PQJ23625.1 hypothetical protein BSZ31_00165 [Limnobacter sp. SAORIC-690]